MNNKNDETIGPSEQDTVNSNNGIINNSTANISILQNYFIELVYYYYVLLIL